MFDFERAILKNEHSRVPHNGNVATSKAFFTDKGRISLRVEPGMIIALASDMHALTGLSAIMLIIVVVSRLRPVPVCPRISYGSLWR